MKIRRLADAALVAALLLTSLPDPALTPESQPAPAACAAPAEAEPHESPASREPS